MLRDLLKKVDGEVAATLALDFAEESLSEMGRCVFSRELRDASTAYLAAARRFLDGGGVDELKSAHERFFGARAQADGVSASALWIAAIAVLAACQRDMERAEIIVKNSYMPTVLDVATEAQVIAGRFASGAQDSQRARWEMARRQLILFVNAIKFPGDNPP
ncbi:hypothetical protein [Plantactinospora sonchi]|uniref:Uncharacterized protein n=1 Tax=Plantactinospora sonchi TaxID=1544735 RepID=A0ABU7S566_9ACTN